MPNSRRRRFSVQKEIRGRDPTKSLDGSQNCPPNLHEDGKNTQTLSGIYPNKLKSKHFPNSSKSGSTLEIVAECDSNSSELAMKKQSSTTVDKDVTASSSAIDLFNLIISSNNSSSEQSKETIPYIKHDNTKESKYAHREKNPVKRDKYPRQHRMKVRSPKRKIANPEEHATVEHLTKSVGIDPIDFSNDSEVQIETVGDVEEEMEEAQASHHSTLDDMCRICHGGDTLNQELGQMISACSCRGTVGRVHVKCLERWLTESGKSRCELCGTRYATRRVHRYGIPRALILWILSQNAKQLMVDGLGIMLMSPLAVLAAWLSGRTLAGLMSYESHVTPWPLASTFVLACMTLVCYYCWIVSAATRHALAWWIWYRSQYEVRLQLQGEQEE